MRKYAIALALFFAPVVPAGSAPLFVGAIEISTEDAAAVRQVVNHCDDLNRTVEVPSLIPTLVQSAPSIQRAVNSMFQAIDADTLMSPGANDGDETDQNDSRDSQVSVLDGLTSIGTGECQAAGLLP